MEPTHIHLLLNHVPILGSLFGLGLLLAGLISKNKSWRNAGNVTLLMVAAISFPAFYSGEEAEHAVEKLPGVSHHLIHEHEEWGEWAFRLIVVTGLCALLQLVWNSIRKTEMRLLNYFTLVFASITFVLMVITGLHGGKIMHPELRGTNAASQQSQPSAPDHEDD